MPKVRKSRKPKVKVGRSSGVQVVPREYAGKWIAWSTDSRRIIAVGDGFQPCEQAAARAGIPGGSDPHRTGSGGPLPPVGIKDVRFDYAEREVDPLPWESGLQVIKEPIIPVRFIGPLRTYLIRGLLDTGASMTLLPRLYLTKLGLVPGERARLRTASGGLDIWVGGLDLELRSGRTIHRWSTRVGFIPRADNAALLGHGGFLDHFSATFDGLHKRVTLRPNGTFPAPVIES